MLDEMLVYLFHFDREQPADFERWIDVVGLIRGPNGR